MLGLGAGISVVDTGYLRHRMVRKAVLIKEGWTGKYSLRESVESTTDVVKEVLPGRTSMPHASFPDP